MNLQTSHKKNEYKKPSQFDNELLNLKSKKLKFDYSFELAGKNSAFSS